MSIVYSFQLECESSGGRDLICLLSPVSPALRAVVGTHSCLHVLTSLMPASRHLVSSPLSWSPAPHHPRRRSKSYMRSTSWPLPHGLFTCPCFRFSPARSGTFLISSEYLSYLTEVSADIILKRLQYFSNSFRFFMSQQPSDIVCTGEGVWGGLVAPEQPHPAWEPCILPPCP